MKKILLVLLVSLICFGCVTPLKIQKKDEQATMSIAPNGDIYLLKNNKLYKIYYDENECMIIELLPLNMNKEWNPKELNNY